MHQRVNFNTKSRIPSGLKLVKTNTPRTEAFKTPKLHQFTCNMLFYTSSPNFIVLKLRLRLFFIGLGNNVDYLR